MDINDFNFTTDANYLKRSISGTVTINVPSYGNANTVTINHNLGYQPRYIVSGHTSNNTYLWTNGEIISRLSDQGVLSGLGTGPQYPTIEHWVTNTQLAIRMHNDTEPASSGSRQFVYTIYLDYKS